MGIRDRFSAALAAARDATETPLPETREPTGKKMWQVGEGIDRDDPPKEDYETYRMQYRTFGPVRAAIDLRASEGVRPGYMIEADDDDLEDALEEWFEEAAVYAGESGEPFDPLLWQIFRDFDLDGEVPIEHYWDDPSADDDERELIGLKLVDPATLKFLTYEGTSMLIRPDDEPSEANGLPEDAPRNKRGELAAYVQYPEDGEWDADPVYLSQKDITRIPRNPGFDTRVSSLSDPMASEVGNIRGTSLVESVSDQIKRLRARMQDYNASIAGLAYPRMKVEFEDYAVGEGRNKEIYQWSDEAIRSYMGDMDRDPDEKEYTPGNEWQEPGGKFGSPPGVDVELIEGSVPDIDDSINTTLSLILSGLGVPKVFVGFGEQLTRDIADDQGGYFDRDISSTRRRVEHKLSMIAEVKGEEFVNDPDHDAEKTDGIRMRVRSEETDSVMRDEEFDAQKFANLVGGLARLYDSGAITEFTSEWLEHELNIDLEDYETSGPIIAEDLSLDAQEFQEEISENRGGPSGNRGSGSWADNTATNRSGGSGGSDSGSDSAAAEEAGTEVTGELPYAEPSRDPHAEPTPETDSETETESEPSKEDDPAMYIDSAALAQYNTGDVVSYGRGEEQTGVILEVLTSDTEVRTGKDESIDVEASQDSPAYVVALGHTESTDVFTDSDLESGEINIDDVENPAADLKDGGDDSDSDSESSANSAALDWNYPRSWRKSKKPNRLILLDAWTSMGGTFSACYPKYGGKRFCASMKDKVYGHTYWRRSD